MADQNSTIVSQSTLDLTCPNPDITNPLYQSGFLLTIDAIPMLNFWCKELTLPDVSLPEIVQETPFIKVPHPGSKVDYSPVQCTIIADEKLANYRALYDWLVMMGFTKDWKQVLELKSQEHRHISPYIIMKDFDSSLQSAATLIIKGPNQTKVATIRFNNLWITQLSSLQLTEENTDSTVVTFNATFNIKDFDFIDID